MQSDSDTFGFDDPDKARQLEALLDSGPDGLGTNFRAALAEVGSPDRVFVRLVHFLDASNAKDLQLERMAGDLEYLRLLTTILDQSQYLTDIISRDPDYLQWVHEDPELTRALTRPELLALFRAEQIEAEGFEAQCEAMRQVDRRVMLRIGVRDVFSHVPMQSVTEELTNLAEAVLEVAFEISYDELTARYGVPMDHEEAAESAPARFVILAMGKLGGRELNYSSDIDLVFVYSDEGETVGPKTEAVHRMGRPDSIANSEFFSKLGEKIIYAVSEATQAGHIFRVDMRLRPHGRMGPLAMSLGSTVLYYEVQGQAWERQALIKARPVAGNVELGRTFMEQTRPFVFPRFFDDATLEEIRQGKIQREEQTANRGETHFDVKLGRGGIRDIEFTVQMLQLLNGGTNPGLRTPNTMETIEALGHHGLMSPFDALTLSTNYIFLRQVENRLQIEGSRQQHALPEEPERLDDFARRLGYQSGASFMVGYRDRADDTRGILEQFLAVEGSGNRWIVDFLNPVSEAPDAMERIAAMGFEDTAKVRTILLDMLTGPAKQPHTAHVRQKVRELTPVLLESLARTPNPDDALVRLAQVLEKLKAPGTLYDVLLQTPELCDGLTKLVSNSRFLSDFIIKDPGLFADVAQAGSLEAAPSAEGLADELALLLGAHDSAAALYRLRDAATLRTGMRDLLDAIDVVEVGRELTRLADLCVREAVRDALEAAADRHGPASVEFAVLGLGKLGGAEMGYGSDLDLVFIYSSAGSIESGLTPAEYFASVAARVIKILSERTRYGRLYEVDARLRPDGSKGVLAISDARFDAYYADEAHAWERLALIKARVVTEQAPFAHSIEERIRAHAFDAPLTPDDLAEIDRIRCLLANEADPHDLKKGVGGLAELEFGVRILQALHGGKISDLQCPDVLGALEALGQSRLMDDQAASALRDAYLFFRTVENRIRMTSGRAGSVLPKEQSALDNLAVRLGIEGDLLERVSEHMGRVHAIYEHILESAAEQ